MAKIDDRGDVPWFIGCGFMKRTICSSRSSRQRNTLISHAPKSLKIWRDPVDLRPARKDAVGFVVYGEAFAKFKDEERSELFRAYCAGTSFIDAQLGRVLDALDKNNLWDKTLVIFLGDHGYHTGDRNWWNKNTLFERSCRAPLVIY